MAKKNREAEAQSEPRSIEQLVDVDDLGQLSPKHRTLARFITANPSFASFATAADLGRRVNMSESTVVRFAQGLGFASYREFRQNLRHHHLGTLVPLEELRKQERPAHDGFALLRKQILQDENNLQAMLDTIHESEIQGLIDEINRARHIVILASGSYTAVALVFGHLLRFMGYAAMVEERGGPNLTATLVPLDQRDLVIGISFWRVIRETAEALSWARKRGVPTFAITDTIFSPLVKSADQSIIMPTESISFFQSMVAPLSFVYAVAAQLALDADEDRERLMQEAVESFAYFQISSKR